MQYNYSNSLIKESSPYLLQHAHNPVEWYAWSDFALQKAKKEDKLILVSIGYAACHWCHVMEHECFENEALATYMNENFICIKVDREERPDIDQVYMEAVQLLTGSGGWPLNCFCLPDAKPFYGGTYFNPKQWESIMKQIVEFVKNNPTKVQEQANMLTNGIQKNEKYFSVSSEQSYSQKDLDEIYIQWKNYMDFEEGGSLRAPKFPLPIGYDYLLHYYFYTQNSEALEVINTTLTKMALGGIYDQLGGGFARYSTDIMWRVPHFEKMLYDNAQLISLYSKAFAATKNILYKNIVVDTIAFVEKEWLTNEGAFYASLDADSEGVEGKYYVWSADEIRNLLNDNASIFMSYFHVLENGNWEQNINILYRENDEIEIAQKYNLTPIELYEKIKKCNKILLAERENRSKPKLDDKVICSWNGLMARALVDAYKFLGDNKYLEMAITNCNFIIQHLKKSDGGLCRNFKNNKASINAFLDDYAFVISAYIALYQATFDALWLYEAQAFCEYAIQHFFDSKSGLFYYTSDIDTPLVARKMELTDNVIPSSNSEMAKNLFILGQYFYNEKYIAMSKAMLNHVKKAALKGQSYYANWDILMAWNVYPLYEVAIVGNNCMALKSEVENKYMPNILLAGCTDKSNIPLLENKYNEEKTIIYVCKDKECKKPETELNKAFEQIL